MTLIMGHIVRLKDSVFENFVVANSIFENISLPDDARMVQEKQFENINQTMTFSAYSVTKNTFNFDFCIFKILFMSSFLFYSIMLVCNT